MITLGDVTSHAAGMCGQPVGVRSFESVPDRGAGREYIPATVIGVIEPAKIERGQGDPCDHLVGHEPQKRIKSFPVTRTTTYVFVLVEDVIREVVVMNPTVPVLGIRVDPLEVRHARDRLRVSVPLPGDHIQFVVVRPQLGQQRVMAFEEDAVLGLVVRVSLRSGEAVKAHPSVGIGPAHRDVLLRHRPLPLPQGRERFEIKAGITSVHRSMIGH